MRFVFLDNDTKLLFATAYDGDWDAHRGLPVEDTRRPRHPLVQSGGVTRGFAALAIKDWLAKHQVSAEAWYVASPNLTAAETRRLERVGKAVEEMLDQIG